MISTAYYKIQEPIALRNDNFITIDADTDRYTLFSMGNNLSMIFLFFSILLFIVYSIWNKKTEVPFKNVFFNICCLDCFVPF